MSGRVRLVVALAVAAVVLPAGLAAPRPPEQRLRAAVDALAVEGLLLALVGALLLADPPFLATRRLLGLAGENRPSSRQRGDGWLALAAGGALFAAAALTWSLAGTG